MGLINEQDDIYYNGVRLDRVYAGDTMVWPQVEVWSPWVEVGHSVLPAPSAWFAGGIVDHYDAGDHEHVRFRYSSLGRVHWRGIMKNISGADLGAGAAVIGCNIDDPNVPKPGVCFRMGSGPAGTAYSPVFGGGYTRFDAHPYDYHHLLKVAHVAAAPIGPGMWFAIDTIYAFSADS